MGAQEGGGAGGLRAMSPAPSAYARDHLFVRFCSVRSLRHMFGAMFGKEVRYCSVRQSHCVLFGIVWFGSVLHVCSVLFGSVKF